MFVVRHVLLPITLLLMPALTRSQTPPVPSAAPLPVQSVSLFTSGVSYTERGGEVNGDASVLLSFPTTQINDLLKSLVLLDEHGQVQPITYGAHDPVSRILQSFAVDVTQTSSRADLLQKLHGTRVSVLTAAGQTLVGQIVGVESRTEHRPDGTTLDTISSLNLLTEAGLQSVDLKDAKAIKILDPHLDQELHQALDVLASGTDDSRRPVTLHFTGQGRRRVRVGYVTEAPLWKISYRLLLGGASGKPAGKPYLQGWALVENTTDDDWNGIHLSLISGRPVSFIQDLYQPLYLPRPIVPPDVVASPYPQTHDSNLQADEPNAPAPENVASAAPPAPSMAAAPSFEQKAINTLSPGSVAGMDAVRDSVTAQAQGTSAGEQYAYEIKTPVTLPRQQAAMIPVVAQEFAGDKVLLYNADSDARFPLDAVRLKNNTSLHLKGGPITLFDEGVYAGDARMEDLAPGETRLISYALDLSVHGERQRPVPSTLTTTFALKRGVLIITRRQRQETTYTFKSQATGPRTVLVEHPYDAQETLVLPAKADERTADVYRFAISLLPGKPQTLTVVTERPLFSQIALLDSDLDVLGVYANGKDVPSATRDALQSAIQRRREIDTLRAAAQQRLAQIASFTADQERIRRNMQALDKSSALYKRYAGELDAQETQIQRFRTEAANSSAQASAAEQAFRAWLDTLSL